MKRLRNLILSLILVGQFVSKAQAQFVENSQIDIQALETHLNQDGIEGWVHGGNYDRQLFVFTYRNPTNFFDYIEFPVTTDDPFTLQALQKVHRNDKVRITGEFIKSPAPIKHIDLSKIEVIEPYVSDVTESASTYQYQGKMEDVIAGGEMTARVHAVAAAGQVLVIEYKDLVIPVFVSEPDQQELVASLYRGDKIKLLYNVRQEPEAPIHLSPKSRNDTNGEDPIQVLYSISAENGTETDRTGSLVFFPRSPEINRNIFALQEADSDSEPIQFTLVNFEDMDLFTAIQDKLQQAWDAHKDTARNGRNKMINDHIVVHAKGTFNEVSPSQANPQILLNRLDDLEISFK